MAKRMTAREAMAIALSGHSSDSWATAAFTHEAWKEEAAKRIRSLRRLGFTVVPLPKHRRAKR